MAVILAVDDTWVNRALVHPAAGYVGDPAARYHGTDRSERNEYNNREYNPVEKPGKAFPNG